MKYKREFLDQIQKVSMRHSLSLYKKIIEEKNEDNLISKMAEALFVLFFDKIGKTLQYNAKVIPTNALTPDIILTINDQKIIAEVCRINPAQENFDHQIKPHQDYRTVEFKKIADRYKIRSGIIKWKPSKINGQKGCLVEKANKYSNLIESEQLPFLICIQMDEMGALDSLDVYHALYGPSGTFDHHEAHEEFYPNSDFHCINEGLFYNNTALRNNVSGLLLLTNGENPTYFHNHNSKNRLIQKNISLLLNWQCPYMQ